MYIYLDLAEHFSCAMCGKCCRNDWLVTMDEQSYRRNAELFSRTGQMEEFHQAFLPLQANQAPGEYACIAKRPEGGCWFLDQDSLCRLHKESGHAHLDSVCQLFPRYPMNTARGVELTLSFNCPAVIKLASEACVTIVRSEQKPLDFVEGNWVVEVYPQQKSPGQPLHYYFELEQHFIDIMQCHRLSVDARLNRLQDTIHLIGQQSSEDFGRVLTGIINANYDWLDCCGPDCSNAMDSCDFLAENYLVHSIFRKLFYVNGLQGGIDLLSLFWRRLDNAKRAADGRHVSLAKTVMELEFEYTHRHRSVERAVNQFENS